MSPLNVSNLSGSVLRLLTNGGVSIMTGACFDAWRPGLLEIPYFNKILQEMQTGKWKNMLWSYLKWKSNFLERPSQSFILNPSEILWKTSRRTFTADVPQICQSWSSSAKRNDRKLPPEWWAHFFLTLLQSFYLLQCPVMCFFSLFLV